MEKVFTSSHRIFTLMSPQQRNSFHKKINSSMTTTNQSSARHSPPHMSRNMLSPQRFGSPFLPKTPTSDLSVSNSMDCGSNAITKVEQQKKIENITNIDTIKSVYLKNKKNSITSIKNYLNSLNQILAKDNTTPNYNQRILSDRSKLALEKINSQTHNESIDYHQKTIARFFRQNRSRLNRSENSGASSYLNEHSKKFGYSQKSLQTNQQSSSSMNSQNQHFQSLTSKGESPQSRKITQDSSYISIAQHIKPHVTTNKNHSRNYSTISKNGPTKASLNLKDCLDRKLNSLSVDWKDSTRDFATKSMQLPDEKNRNEPNFLQNIYSNEKFTQVANDSQYRKLETLLCEYYGMKEQPKRLCDLKKKVPIHLRGKSTLRYRDLHYYKIQDIKILENAENIAMEEYYNYVQEMLKRGRDSFYSAKYAKYKKMKHEEKKIKSPFKRIKFSDIKFGPSSTRLKTPKISLLLPPGSSIPHHAFTRTLPPIKSYALKMIDKKLEKLENEISQSKQEN